MTALTREQHRFLFLVATRYRRCDNLLEIMIGALWARQLTAEDVWACLQVALERYTRARKRGHTHEEQLIAPMILAGKCRFYLVRERNRQFIEIHYRWGEIHAYHGGDEREDLPEIMLSEADWKKWVTYSMQPTWWDRAAYHLLNLYITVCVRAASAQPSPLAESPVFRHLMEASHACIHTPHGLFSFVREETTTGSFCHVKGFPTLYQTTGTC